MKLRKLARRQMAQARGCHKTYPRGLQMPKWFSAKPWWMRRQLYGVLHTDSFSGPEWDAAIKRVAEQIRQRIDEEILIEMMVEANKSYLCTVEPTDGRDG